KEFSKLDYIFDRKDSTVSILDQQKFYKLLINKNLIDQYEMFAMGYNPDLGTFLNKCNLTPAEQKSIFSYRIKSMKAADDKYHQIKEFMRNGSGKIYVPGSSVKGALRTVLLQERILNDKKGRNPALDIKDIKNHESDYLNTLHFKKAVKQKQSDAVNSIMRGISVSDSAFIDLSDMTIADKQDELPDGTISEIPLTRECIKPGTKIYLKLTLDQSILKGTITGKSLAKSIDDYDAYFYDTYIYKFAPLPDDAEVSFEDCLILGGGAGYLSKAVTYPYYGEKEAVNKVADCFQDNRMFKKHNHYKDKKLGISPRTLKYAEYQSKLYNYGVCGVEIK
ncbi:MAG: type III-A CRISPR-associated RAMP protein Csm5, partial [Eubacteriaceae bacterium]